MENQEVNRGVQKKTTYIRRRARIIKPTKLKYSKIVKNVSEVPFGLKKAKNTIKYLIKPLKDKIKAYRHVYTVNTSNLGLVLQNQVYQNCRIRGIDGKLDFEKLDFYDQAIKMLGIPSSQKVKSQKPQKAQLSAFTVNDLEQIYGARLSDGENGQQQKKRFIVCRLNARVLSHIFQECTEQIVFGNDYKSQDKMTHMLFINQYMSRLMNPLLCAGLQCPRPMFQKA